jgi:hypothetical protein
MANTQLSVEERLANPFGWTDYNDLATTSTPIPLSVAGTFYPLTNDGAGANSDNTFKIPSHGEIWDTTADEFDFSSLKVGDTVAIRVDYSVTTSGVNRDIETEIQLAIGSAGPYSLNMGFRSYKASGTYPIVIEFGFYIGDTNTLNFPGKVAVRSDNTGDTVVVNGWYIRTLVR